MVGQRPRGAAQQLADPRAPSAWDPMDDALDPALHAVAITFSDRFPAAENS
jgi:hypothetical protein